LRKMNRKVWTEICAGIAKAIPIFFAYLPLGITVGLFARDSNLKLTEIALMSASVYTCIGQIVAIKMLTSGSGLWSISIAVFLVSLRHMLMSITLAPFLKKARPAHLALLAFGITDEPFALGVHELRYRTGSIYVFTGIVFMCWLSWVTSSLIGYSLGQFGGFFNEYGLKFTLPALLISLTFLQIKEKGDIASALFSGALTILCLSFFSVSLSISLIIISVLGASSGALVEAWMKKSGC
jgi:4-azaleucine resistance transporter AzlC